MLFWAMWTIAFLAVGGFFLASLRAYLAPATTTPASYAFIAGSDPHASLGDPRLIALEAQLFLAPMVALAELREMVAAGEISVATFEVYERDAVKPAAHDNQDTLPHESL